MQALPGRRCFGGWSHPRRGLRLQQQAGEQTILDGGAVGTAIGAAGQVEAKRGSLGGGGTRDHALIEQAARLLTIHRVVSSHGWRSMLRCRKRRLTLCSILF